MRVILRPIRKNSWSGLVKYRNCYEDIAPYWTRSGRIYTGLTSQDEERLGKELGYDLKTSSDYWKTFFIRTFGRDYYLNTEDAFDELRYLFLKHHKRVKTSLSEHKATANFLLLNKDEEAKRTNVYNRIRREAVVEFGKLSTDDIRKCLRLYGHNADRMSNEVAENRLFELVEGNPKAFLNRWVENKSREIEVIIERAISRNVIRRNKNIYRYGTEIIGHSILDTIGFLSDPKNQDIKMTIMKQVDSKASIGDEPIYKEPEIEVPESIKQTARAFIEPGDEKVEEAKAASIRKTKGDTI